VLPTADGHVRLLAVTPRQWGALIALLQNRPVPARRAPIPAPGGRGPVAGLVARLTDEGAHLAVLAVRGLVRLPLPGGLLPVFHAGLALVRGLAGEALRDRPRATVLAQARALGLPIAPVNRPEEFVRAAQTRARRYFLRTGFPSLGDAPFAPLPCRLGRTPASVRRPAPAAGENGRRGFPRRAPAPAGGNGRGPVLAGTRVINLGVGAVVPELCRSLAELGATVIKIESPDHPDFLRRLTVEPDAPNRSWMFNDENRGQQSVCLDLRSSRGRELALALCARADVVAENRQGGVVRRFGLDYDDVRRVRPDVIYVASQGYGRGGPLGEAPAFGPLNAAFAGLSYLWNHPDAPYPAGSSLEHPDHLAGRLAAVAVLAALEHRRRTGEGQLIEMAQTEAAAYLLGEFYLQGPCTGHAPRPAGNAVPYACPHGVYPCAGEDRWVAIAVVGDEAWRAFRSVVGWADEPALATLAGRLERVAALDERVAEWTREQTPAEVASALQAAGVSAAPVYNQDDLRADAHLAKRGAIVTVEHPEIGPERHAGNPLRFSRLPIVTAGPAPLLGEHTASVLGRWLGLGEDDVRRLAADGVCR
jgi:crotonobetainyl-CoA:carnitine CoA-transferase CaiB-like acyl-CoA transferase